MVELFHMLTLAAETGDLHLVDGGIIDQPDWWVETMSWFLPAYNHAKFFSRVRSLVGDEKLLKKAASKVGKER